MLHEFDYVKICRMNHGNKEMALAAMVNSLKIYYPNRSNFIARKRAKSAIGIIRRLRVKIEKLKSRCKCRFANDYSSEVILCDTCGRLPCHNMGDRK